jgi:hypothetical protein
MPTSSLPQGIVGYREEEKPTRQPYAIGTVSIDAFWSQWVLKSMSHSSLTILLHRLPRWALAHW